jgi:hypothetical protein
MSACEFCENSSRLVSRHKGNLGLSPRPDRHIERSSAVFEIRLATLTATGGGLKPSTLSRVIGVILLVQLRMFLPFFHDQHLRKAHGMKQEQVPQFS